MALINCPECNNQVSTTAELCPHCGFNIKRIISYCPFCKTEKVLMIYNKSKNDLTCPKCGFGGKIASAEQERVEELQKANQPKCPTCQSTNLKKISTTSKTVNTVAFGLFGTKRHKTFHCNSCGYEW